MEGLDCVASARHIVVMTDAYIDGVEWRTSPAPVPYEEALAAMEHRAAAIHAGEARELVWLLEHPPLYTAGTSADPAELLAPDRFPVYKTGRGGRYTYHGPGQRIGYVMIDLEKRGRDIRCFVSALERWLIASLAALGIEARQEPGRIGLWTGHGSNEAKIAAIGVRVRRWVTFHGFSINVDPDLSHFGGIVPCGISEYDVTSLKKLGILVEMDRVDAVLKAHFGSFLEQISRSARLQSER